MPLVFCVMLYRGLALCLIPKVASTSMKVAIEQGSGAPPYRIHRDRVPKDAFVAAFVRHPAARLVSAWAGIVYRADGSTIAWRRLRRLGCRHEMGFQEFAVMVCNSLGKLGDKHLLPQSLFLPRRLSFVGRMDTMATGWRSLQERFSWLPELEVHNQSERNDWRSYYDQSLLDRVQRFYASDYERWLSAK